MIRKKWKPRTNESKGTVPFDSFAEEARDEPPVRARARGLWRE